MENDSVLSAVIFGISALLMGAFEAGAGAVARALREKAALENGAETEELKEGAPLRDKWLPTVMSLPGGAGAALRCAGVGAGALALAAASVAAVAEWGLRWELIFPVVAGATVALAAVGVIGRALGARFSNSALPAACRVSRWLSFPLMPALLVYGRLLPKWSGSGADSNLDISADPYEFLDMRKILDAHEAEMVRGVVGLDKTTAINIMTPRVDVAMANEDATLSELADVMTTAGHSRIPIISKGDPNKIIGVAHARDLMKALADGERSEGKTAGDVARREPMTVTRYQTLEDVLRKFKNEQTHLALVVGEFGGVSGIVTIEDLLEQIVGEIHDEFDKREEAVVRLGDSEYMVNAGMSLEDFNREMKRKMKVEAGETDGNGFVTIGGFVFDKLGRIPVPGDKVEYGDSMTLEVVDVSGRRLVRLRAKKLLVDGETSEDKRRSGGGLRLGARLVSLGRRAKGGFRRPRA